MKCSVVLIVCIGLTAAQTIKNNETATEWAPPHVVSAGNNLTNSETNANSSLIEFFGPIEEKSTPVDQNIIQKANITSKVEYKKKKYRIKNYGQDPLQSNAQSPNPFVSGAPGSRGSRRGPGSGIDPQIALLLQNNPRIPEIATLFIKLCIVNP